MDILTFKTEVSTGGTFDDDLAVATKAAKEAIGDWSEWCVETEDIFDHVYGDGTVFRGTIRTFYFEKQLW